MSQACNAGWMACLNVEPTCVDYGKLVKGKDVWASVSYAAS